MTGLPEHDSDRYRILDERDNYVYIYDEEANETELIPWSDLNKAVYKHGLRNLLVDRDSTYTFEKPSGTEVTVEPTERNGINVYLVSHGTAQVVVTPDNKKVLLDALVRLYDSQENGDPDFSILDEMMSELADTAVLPEVVRPLAEQPYFEDAVEVMENGWLIHDHVLLTFDNEFYHPKVTSTTRSGAPVNGERRLAYELRFEQQDDGQSELGDFEGIDPKGTKTFIAMAIWAVEFTADVDPTEHQQEIEFEDDEPEKAIKERPDNAEHGTVVNRGDGPEYL